jgi:hypothetical protein
MASQHVPSGPRSFDTSGRRIEGEGERQGVEATARPQTVTACFELRGTGAPEQGGPVTFEVQLVVNPNTYPFVVQSGSISGDICRVLGTHWVVTEGSFGPTLSIQARRTPDTNAPSASQLVGPRPCAQAMSIIGVFQPPASYAGTYGTDGSDNDFVHTTLFKGWQPCS